MKRECITTILLVLLLVIHNNDAKERDHEKRVHYNYLTGFTSGDSQ